MAARTPLHEQHLALGARLTEFGGWEMPREYSGSVAEHLAVRKQAGLFDTSHMGQIVVAGEGAEAFADRMITCPVKSLKVGRMRYGFLCDGSGGVIDDLTVYRKGPDEFLLVTNASTTPGDLEWLWEHIPDDGVAVADETARTAKLDLQGPAAGEIIAPVTDIDTGSLKFWRFKTGKVCGADVMVSRSGYTGEYGFEIYCAAEDAERVWSGLLEAGAGAGLVPCGLAARNTLRIEACLPLYGHELSRDWTPYEAGLGGSVDADKPGLVGGEALRERRDSGPERTLVAFVTDGPAPIRDGAKVVKSNGDEIGEVSSGTYCPSVELSCGMAFISQGKTAPGTELAALRRNAQHVIRIVDRPIYTEGTARR